MRKTDHTALYTAKVGSIQQQVVRKTDHTALYTAKGGSMQQQVVSKTDHTALYTAKGGSIQQQVVRKTDHTALYTVYLDHRHSKATTLENLLQPMHRMPVIYTAVIVMW